LRTGTGTSTLGDSEYSYPFVVLVFLSEAESDSNCAQLPIVDAGCKRQSGYRPHRSTSCFYFKEINHARCHAHAKPDATFPAEGRR
jgi:hypothetical protein